METRNPSRTISHQTNFPNTAMCFVVGYMGPTFLDQIIEKMRRISGRGNR
jgi:putative lipoic acid-binding regulatory protein